MSDGFGRLSAVNPPADAATGIDLDVLSSIPRSALEAAASDPGGFGHVLAALPDLLVTAGNVLAADHAKPEVSFPSSPTSGSSRERLSARSGRSPGTNPGSRLKILLGNGFCGRIGNLTGKVTGIPDRQTCSNGSQLAPGGERGKAGSGRASSI